MAGASDTAVSIIEWYRGAGNIRSVKRGLDDRSFIIELSGRREMKVLAVVYDPSVDEDPQDLIDSLLASYGRARINFDRLDLWVPIPLYSKAQELIEEVERKGLSWTSKVSLRPLAIPRDLGGEEEGHVRGAGVKHRGTVRSSSTEVKPELSREPRDSRDLLIREVGREIGEVIARSLEESLRNILSSTDRRGGDSELVSKIYELEKRVELLESFLRMLGSYGLSNVPQIRSETPQIREQFHFPKAVEESRSRVEEATMNIKDSAGGEEPIGLNASADDVLAEIFNNPWVSILRKKGEGVEGESDRII